MRQFPTFFEKMDFKPMMEKKNHQFLNELKNKNRVQSIMVGSWKWIYRVGV